MLSNLRFPALLILLSTFGALAGCGGHRSGNSSTAKDTIVFDNGRVAAVSDEAKAADEAKLEVPFSASWGADNGAQARQIVAAMKAMPEFRLGAISPDGNAWGRYTDGTDVVYMTNDPDGPGATPALGRGVVKPSLSQAQSAHARDLPEVPTAYVFNAMEPRRSAIVALVTAELKEAGYAVHSGMGSLDDWIGLSKAGVLVNNSHGGTHDGDFYIESSDVPSPALTAQYLSDLTEHRMDPCHVHVLDDSAAGFHDEARYEFSAEFLQKHAAFSSLFAKNSLFVSLSCAGAKNPFFYLVLQKHAGLDVYAGWDEDVKYQDANEATAFLFDRALGLNQAAPVDPASPPPASLSSIAGLLDTTAHQDGSAGTMNQSGHTEADNRRIVAEFKFYKSDASGLTTLIPSATSASLTADGTKLDIKGDFGADQGTVTVAGKQLAIVSWSAKEILAAKPDATGKAFVTSPTGLIGNSVPIAGSLLTITPNKPTVALGSTTTFTVATELGSFPSGAKFTWTVKGTGTVGGASSATTTVPHVDYVAPKEATTDTLTVSVKDAKGEPLGSGGTNVDVGDAATVSLTISGSWERYGNEGGLGVVPNNGTYTFADGVGARFDPQAPNEPANFELIDLDYANYDDGDGTYSPGITLALRVSKGEAVKEGFAYPLVPPGNGGFGLDSFSIGLQTPFLVADEAICPIGSNNATGALTFTNIQQASDGTTSANYEMNYSNSTGGVLKATGVGKWKHVDRAEGRRRSAALPPGRVAH